MRPSAALFGVLFTGFVLVTWTGFEYARDRIGVQPLTKAHSAPARWVFTFAGDIMAHDVNFNRPPYDRIYDDIRGLLTRDALSFANLEFPVDQSKPMSTYPRFNVHTPYIRSAVDAGFDVFAASNNHSTDQGPDSILRTASSLSALSESRWSGLREHKEDPMYPQTIHYGNIRIGFLSITLFVNLAEGKDLVHTLNMYDQGRIDAFASFLSEVTPGYDLFILSVHGGTEYRQVPTEAKYRLFHRFIDAGVDILWGHHPHVLQPYEYVTAEGERKLIIYSAGNLISGQTWRLDPLNPDPRTAPTGESALFQVELEYDGKKARITGVELQFIFNYREKTMVVRRAETLLDDPVVSEEWKRYYQDRYKELKRFTVPFEGL